MSGIGDFEIFVQKRDSLSSVSTAASSSGKVVGNMGARNQWDHILLLPSVFGTVGPVIFDNLNLTALRTTLHLEIPITLKYALPPPEYSFDTRLEIFGEDFIRAVDIPGKIRLISQLDALRGAVESALGRKLTQPELLHAINSLEIPLALRNEAINSLFRPPDISPSASVANISESGNEDPLASLLGSVALGEKSNPITPRDDSGIDGLVREAGNMNSGFVLREKEGSQFLARLEKVQNGVHESLKANKSALDALGFVSAIKKLIRKTNGRRRQRTILLSYHSDTNSKKALLSDYLRDSDTRPMALIIPEFDSSPGSFRHLGEWLEAAQEMSCPILLQVNEDYELIEKLGAVLSKSSWGRNVYLFGGRVVGNLPGKSGTLQVFRASALAFLELILEKGAAPGVSEGGPLILEEQDVLEGKPQALSIEPALSLAEAEEYRKKSVNFPCQVRGKDAIFFHPLVAFHTG